ncbi:ribonuclease J [Metabacillus sp. GX 13764]|uniref:ribonuclease J n=1 Tax=Metabacillus kandeliae TaxID=2900151 RepID=UPI001E2A24F0|nr:ribonuclease J [Metabacillus kandeliae]MCD7033725.1 ribonuclease J [Metabacillus kandeliae]
MNQLQTENIRLIALGGVGEIGKNMFVVEIGADIFVVDAGLMHPEGEMLGIDVVIPDISYLIENRSRVKAVFLTHGHDENIGGIFYVLQKLSVPVYGTKLTLALVTEKLKEYGMKQSADLRKITTDSIIKFGKVKISFFGTNHSIPDSVGVALHTPQGAIVHTGDFKFDQTPVGEQTAEIAKMANLGKDGVLCLLSDSTNAEKPGYSGSESTVGKEISNVIYTAPERVIIAVFSSNFYRIQQVIDAAHENGRKLVIVGKNLMNVIQIARRLGYIAVEDELFISINEMEQYDKNKVAILTTGSHGEPLAALTRMAKHSHKQLNIVEGDTVLISATPIPGHELAFSKTIDLLYRAGANVVFGQKPIHVSGHGHQEELKLMLNLMKPKYFIPVNGEYKMQKAHEKLALSVGIAKENIFLIEKGDAVEFLPEEVRNGSKVPFGNVLIDGLGIGDVGNIVLRDRRLLSQDGILIVVVTLDKSKKLIVAGPEILSRGFVYVRESEELLERSTEIVAEIVDKCMKDYNIEWSSLKLSIREALNQYLYEKTKRRPMILPIIMEV